MKTRITIAGIVVVIIAATSLKLQSNKRVVDGEVYHLDLEKRILVQAATAEFKTLNKAFSYTGTFAPYREVMVVPQVHGQVEGVYFEEGDIVQTGKPLVQIDDDLLQTQYNAAEANYQISKRNVERYENASEGGGVSKIQLDNFHLNLKTAESELNQLLKQIEWSRITAPFTGTVTLRDVEIGSVVGSAPVARITDMSQLKLEISVPEKEITMFHEGETVEIVTDIYPGKTLVGKVDYVAGRADASHNYDVKIIIKNGSKSTQLKAGMYGTARMGNNSSNKTLLIPREALIGSAKNPQVFVIEDGKAVMKNIQTGNSSNEAVEVIQGINAGEVVVVSGHINLTNGTPVEIVK